MAYPGFLAPALQVRIPEEMSRTWSCPLCTLEQPIEGIFFCGGCGNPRPEEIKDPSQVVAPEERKPPQEHFAPEPTAGGLGERAAFFAPPMPVTVPIRVFPPVQQVKPAVPVGPIVPVRAPILVRPKMAYVPPGSSPFTMRGPVPTPTAAVVVPAGSGLDGQPPVKVPPPKRLAVSNFSPELLAMGDTRLVDLLQDSLSQFGPLVGRPSLITRSVDGVKTAFVQFRDGNHAQEAIEGAIGLGFEIAEANLTHPSQAATLRPLHSGQAGPTLPVQPWPSTKPMFIYIDELSMPERPEVEPSPTDREVWVDPLPDEHEVSDWLKAFGEVEEVARVPGPEKDVPGEKGYVQFKDHEAAKACVDMRAGSWSESERSLASQISVRRSVVRTYPESIVSAFLGKKGEDINKLRKDCGIWKLAVKGQDLARDPSKKGAVDGDPSDGEAVGNRLHFYAEGTPESLDRLRPELERRLAEIHSEVKKRLEEMGEEWKAEQERQLAKHKKEEAEKQSAGRRRPRLRKDRGPGGGAWETWGNEALAQDGIEHEGGEPDGMGEAVNGAEEDVEAPGKGGSAAHGKSRGDFGGPPKGQSPGGRDRGKYGHNRGYQDVQREDGGCAHRGGYKGDSYGVDRRRGYNYGELDTPAAKRPREGDFYRQPAIGAPAFTGWGAPQGKGRARPSQAAHLGRK